MIVLVSGATGTHRRFWDHPGFGHLVTPRTGNSKVIAESGKAWAADNDAFAGWDADKAVAFAKMLWKICADGRKDTCRFVAAPDVVADAKTTSYQFEHWAPIIANFGLPVALVAQDGINLLPSAGRPFVPWDRIDALFIGGSTEFKLSRDAEQLIVEAKALGKWVHVGRVNTLRRVRHFHEIGVDSIDGTCFSKWPDKYFPGVLRWLARLDNQTHFLTAKV